MNFLNIKRLSNLPSLPQLVLLETLMQQNQLVFCHVICNTKYSVYKYKKNFARFTMLIKHVLTVYEKVRFQSD